MYQKVIKAINHKEAIDNALSYQLQKDSAFRYIFERIESRSKEGLCYYYFDLDELPNFEEYLKGIDECSNPIQQLIYFFNVFESLGYKIDFSSEVNHCDLDGLINLTDEFDEPQSETDQKCLIELITKNILTFTLY